MLNFKVLKLSRLVGLKHFIFDWFSNGFTLRMERGLR